jgi:predicted  nucleic acid-binding Zn-ribbon protein
MEKLKSSKAIALVSTALMVASIFWLLNTKSINRSLESGLESEKLKSEQLLSEKLQVEKELEKFKEQLMSLKEQNLDLDNVLKSVTTKLQLQEADYVRMKKENISLAQLRKQKQNLLTLQTELQNELTQLKISYAALESKNNDLNTAVAQLQERNKLLTDDLNKAMFAALDQSQIQALRGKSEKLTVKAKRTRKLMANFEIPSNLKNLSFRIVDSNGNTLSQNDGRIAATVTPSHTNFIASSDSDVTGSKLQKVEMVYMPKEKLKSGVYTVEILNDNFHVGSLKVKLK